MSAPDPASPPNEFLVISRGQWDAGLQPETIQKAIDQFYSWIDVMVAEGKMKTGHRLATAGKVVSRSPGITDGPYGETKEVIGGYWFVLASDLDQAAEFMSGNPCIACGLSFELRPLEHVKASAYEVTNETPGSARA